MIDGCRYREALQAVAVEGGVAANVVPDLATLTLNHRFAPDRDAAAAEARPAGAARAARSTRPTGDTVEVDRQRHRPPRPGSTHPLLAATASRPPAPPPRAKLGWTDVAFFAERGIPAANFGPGDPELAHTAGERVEPPATWIRAYATLARTCSTAVVGGRCAGHRA